MFVIASLVFFVLDYFEGESTSEGWFYNNLAIMIAVGNGIARVFKYEGSDDDDDYIDLDPYN